VFGVRPDRFDHEVEFVGTVDFARYAVGHVGPDEQGFGEGMEPVNALRVKVQHQEHRARRATVTCSMVCSVLLDHFGWVGFEVHRLNPPRLAGCALLLAGLFLVSKF